MVKEQTRMRAKISVDVGECSPMLMRNAVRQTSGWTDDRSVDRLVRVVRIDCDYIHSQPHGHTHTHNNNNKREKCNSARMRKIWGALHIHE